MEFTVSKADLSRALSVTQNAVAKKTTMPILSNVLISAAENLVRISATDLEITAEVRAQAKVKKKGSTTVSSRMFSDIVRELPDGDITIKLCEAERIEITAGKSKFKVIGTSSDEYPSLPGATLSPRASISAAQLAEMINKTIYSVSVDDTRINLTGVCMEVVSESKGKKGGNKVIRMVATDGHRLAMITRPADGLDFQGRAIVPRKGLAEVRKIVEAQGESEVRIDVNEGFFILEAGETRVAVRLADAEYPNYEGVIPKDKGERAKIAAGDLVQALRRAALMVSDQGKCIRMDFSKNLVRISGNSPELGEATEELPVQYQGGDLSIGFNAGYLLDFAATSPSEGSILLELNGELAAGKLFVDGDESYLGIVMPMRLN